MPLTKLSWLIIFIGWSGSFSVGGQFGQKVGAILGENGVDFGQKNGRFRASVRWFWEPFTVKKKMRALGGI